METRKIWVLIKRLLWRRSWWCVQMALMSPYEVSCRPLKHDGNRLLLGLKAGDVATFHDCEDRPDMLLAYVKAVDLPHALHLMMPRMASQLQEFLSAQT